MVSLEETHRTTPKCLVVEPISSPRISFSAEFLDENNFISICPNLEKEKDGEKEIKPATRNADFEFLSGNLTNMITADELFCEGKLLPFWQAQHAEKLNKITLKIPENGGPHEDKDLAERNNDDDVDGRRISWFLDDDPSPRPPKCTVLWKELLRLKKQRASTLSPSSSSSSGGSLAQEKVVNRVKKGPGLEIRTRSASNSIRIRPMVNIPICTQGKKSSLPPLFSLRRGRSLD